MPHAVSATSPSAAPPPVAALTYSVDEVAAALGYASAASFRKARPQLEAAGFPRRIPNMGARWSRAAVDAWVAQAGTEG